MTMVTIDRKREEKRREEGREGGVVASVSNIDFSLNSSELLFCPGAGWMDEMCACACVGV